MNIVKFTCNRNKKEKYLTNDKLSVAYKLIDFMNDTGMDFHIVVEREVAETAFELERIKGDKVLMTSNLEKAKALKIKDTIYFPIEGNEF